MYKKTRVLIEMQPRGLDRKQASAYVNLSTTKFDQLVAEGRLPPPKLIDSRKVWDRLALIFILMASQVAMKVTSKTRGIWPREEAEVHIALR